MGSNMQRIMWFCPSQPLSAVNSSKSEKCETCCNLFAHALYFHLITRWASGNRNLVLPLLILGRYENGRDHFPFPSLLKSLIDSLYDFLMLPKPKQYLLDVWELQLPEFPVREVGIKPM